jgi:hypothetical protein
MDKVKCKSSAHYTLFLSFVFADLPDAMHNVFMSEIKGALSVQGPLESEVGWKRTQFVN